MASSAAKGQTTKPKGFSLDEFLHLTTSTINQLTPTQAWVDGGLVNYQLPQAGLTSMGMLYVSATITVAGTISSGTFKGWPNPAPMSILKNVSLGSNQNLSLINASGWGLYKWVRERYGRDLFRTSNNDFFASSNVCSQLGLGNAVTPVIPNANVAAGTYTIRFALPIPIAYNRELYTGLLFLQNNSVLYTLGLQFGNITGGIGTTGGTNDLFDTLIGTGISVTATVTTKFDLETVLIPAAYPPNTSMFMSLQESIFPLTQGENAIQPPVNDIYTLIMLELSNNKLQVPQGNISNGVFLYSLNQRRFQESFPTKSAWDYWLKGAPPSDGLIVYDMGIRKGLKDKRDVYDAFNNSQVTGFQLQFNQSGAITAPAQTTFTAESLRFITQG